MFYFIKSCFWFFVGGLRPPGSLWLRPLAAGGTSSPRTPLACPSQKFLIHSKMMPRILPRGLGACVAARACYADSNAPILIKIRWILTIVFVI